MIHNRVIPCLLLKGSGLVKTVKFKNPKYLGDPRNTIKIFNEKEVDELILLDITATTERRGPNINLLSDIVSECFMPLGYGGGIKDLNQIEILFKLGMEKAIINTHGVENPGFICEAAKIFGSQSIVVSLDMKRNLFGKYEIVIESGRRKTGLEPVEFTKKMEDAGAGEIFLNSIDRDGTMQGFDIELIRSVTSAISIPVIACGGAGSVEDLRHPIKQGCASAVAAGSIFVFHGRHNAVLINYPKRNDLERILN